MKEKTMLPEPPAKGSLQLFVREAWPQVVVAPLEWGNVLESMSEQIEQALHEPGTPCLIACPTARCGKTMLMSVLLPAWIWTWAPAARLMTVGVSERAAHADARLTRELLRSVWYRRRWGEGIVPFATSNLAFTENRAGGYRRAVGVRSAISGLRVDVAIADCIYPFAYPGAERGEARDRVDTWWQQEALKRVVPGGHMLRVEESILATA
ncbi:hypothetical protein EOD42_13985 [Rhodovarius crocodyli]|uniref:Terminase n=1 Tax=Rhodovarius crocodyli TaxID=1979269 RepID=A0A437MEY2_9PROT|nr:hypothetical protein [Rhodovarius crocodyli]RVT96221.1 hypothetical protein EOD42_13985 [Rhodovarius crocodyli]